MLSISEDHFRVLEAIYGTKTHRVKVTREIIKLIKDNKLDFTISNDVLGGDPHPGKVKQLTIEYIFDGDRLTKTYPEGARLQLPD